MSDEKVVEEMALLWLSKGKDAEGFSWFMWNILKKIRQLEKEKKEEDIW